MTDLTSDLQVTAATLYGESRGETELGQEAVAAVIANRVAYARQHHYPEFGNGTFRSACLAPWQFSCWNHNDPNWALINALDFVNPSLVLAGIIAIANDAIQGDLHDPTGGALFYKVSTLPWPASWGAQRPPLATIGHQSFYGML